MRGWKLLIPVGICWLGALTVRSFSDHGVFWQHNDFVTAARFLFGSPLLGLFPNLNKESYFSVPILFLFVAMVLFLGRAAWKQGIVLALLICFFGAVVPWVRGGNPSSRYFYLAMPFLYLALTLALQQLKSQYIAWGIATALLVSQFWSTYERAVLWVEADQQAHALMKEVVVLLSTFPSEKMVIVNVPEAYGPQQMPMRPQMWYCGFKEYLRGRNIDVALVKTDDSPFVWERSPDRLSRDAVAAAYPEKTLYEVVYHQERFTLVPFNQSAFENKS
jgi:hypothetical protein